MRGDIQDAGYVGFFTALIDGRLKLGQTLTQEQLCDILGMSLSPLRDSVTLLESEGMVTIRRKVGITVFYPDVKFFGNTFQFRGLLEKEGLRKFARIVAPAWIARMREDHDEIIRFVTEVGDMDAYRIPVKALEDRFHNSFIEVFDNDQITVNYARLKQKMYILRLTNPESVDTANTVTSMEEHLAIIDALERRDGEAAADAMERHLQGVLHRTLTT